MEKNQGSTISWLRICSLSLHDGCCGRFAPVSAPIVILGTEPVHVAEEALAEGPNATLGDLETLLATQPRAAVITSGGNSGFFRASLCLERGISRVVLRRGLFEEAWERELAARAATFGAELHVHDDSRGYGRVKPGARVPVGMPETHTWSRNTCGFVVDDALREEARNAAPLNVDPEIDGLPSNLEEVAFGNGDKPVLYLVVPRPALEEVRAKYYGMAMVCREIPLSIEGATGRRMYTLDAGETNAHVFVSRDPRLAERVARLWDEGSSRNAVAIGELLGYPPCCAAAFAALGERGNNAALTYVTAARSHALAAPFHALLNSAVRHVLPCTPCSFGCARATTLAERVLAALPAYVASALERALRRPVLYFNEACALVFDEARVEGQTITFEQVRFLPASAPLAADDELTIRRLWGALLAGSGTLCMGQDAFEVHTGAKVRRVQRSDSRLGIVLPFGRAK